jgi:hypothetical protein
MYDGGVYARSAVASAACWEARSRVLVSVHQIIAVHVLVVDVKLSLVLFVLFVEQLMRIGLGLRMEDLTFRLARGVAVDCVAIRELVRSWEEAWRFEGATLERNWGLGL